MWNCLFISAIPAGCNTDHCRSDTYPIRISHDCRKLYNTGLLFHFYELILNLRVTTRCNGGAGKIHRSNIQVLLYVSSYLRLNCSIIARLLLLWCDIPPSHSTRYDCCILHVIAKNAQGCERDSNPFVVLHGDTRVTTGLVPTQPDVCKHEAELD